MRNLAGKRALVTGAASGIGRHLALQLAAQGTDVCLWDRNPAGLRKTQAECLQLGVDSIRCEVELSSAEQIAAGVEDLLARWGSIDILVNNAGVGYMGSTQDMTEHQWQTIVDINLWAPVRIIHALLPTLLSRPESHILNVSSMLGLCPAPRGAAYCTTKYALVGLSDALRVEYRRSPLGVTVLCPGFVDTQLFTNGQVGDPRKPIRRPSPIVSTTPDKVARKGIRGIQRNRRKVVVTPLAHGVCFLNRHLPSIIELASWIGRRKGPIAKPASIWPNAHPQLAPVLAYRDSVSYDAAIQSPLAQGQA